MSIWSTSETSKPGAPLPQLSKSSSRSTQPAQKRLCNLSHLICWSKWLLCGLRWRNYGSFINTWGRQPFLPCKWLIWLSKTATMAWLQYSICKKQVQQNECGNMLKPACNNFQFFHFVFIEAPAIQLINARWDNWLCFITWTLMFAIAIKLGMHSLVLRISTFVLHSLVSTHIWQGAQCSKLIVASPLLRDSLDSWPTLLPTYTCFA